jgi:hypothetical protein
MMVSSSLRLRLARRSGGITNWAYKDANERARIREESRKDGNWPPATRGMFIKQENMLVVPASFSPLR